MSLCFFSRQRLGQSQFAGQGPVKFVEHRRTDQKQVSFPDSALIREKYRGIRPAPGYPACPEHTEKALLWELIDPVTNADISITEHFAMLPTAAVSGWYFSHPESKYFGVGKINRDQAEDYARRKGMTVEEAERWLAPNLGYNPDEKAAANG